MLSTQIDEKEKMDAILEKIVDLLSGISGLEAIVLGGSQARGSQDSDSDIDIGLYYHQETVDWSQVEKQAQELDQEHRENLLAKPGEWGEWVNGGCWLMIENKHVDLILRDIERVKKAIQEGQEGIITPHYQVGHPHAYLNIMYMGELAVSKLLWYRDEKIYRLKTFAEEYPQKLKEKIISQFFFEAMFSQELAEKNAARDDIYYVVAHLIRSVSALNQVLFALNEQYCINEKNAVKMIDAFNVRPDSYKKKIDNIFYWSAFNLLEACHGLKQLIEEVNFLK